MIYQLDNGGLVSCGDLDLPPAGGGSFIGVFPIRGGRGVLPQKLRDTVFANEVPRFVSQEGMDILCLQAGMLEKRTRFHPVPLYLFLQKDRLWIFCREPAVPLDLLERMRLDGVPEYGFGGILCELLRLLLREDSVFLERFEQLINTLEDEVLENSRQNFTKDIMFLRKQLTVLSRYYEQLLDIFDEIELNENGLLAPRSLRQLKIIDGKIGRLYSNVQHLRDYVTQVREAYQSEVDIRLNRTMKLLTVLTAIFLPLSLVAGWYGMNFDMPEYRSPFGYPILILVSVLLVAGTVAAFRKNKWF